MAHDDTKADKGEAAGSDAASPKIDPKAYQERLDRLLGILGDIAVHADVQATFRCPYKNRHDECTALFGCRNQRKPRGPSGLLICDGSDKLDYHGAWEHTPLPQEAGSGTVIHAGSEGIACKGRTLFDSADDLKVQVATSCGRSGHCHECIVEVIQGAEALSEPTEAEAFLRGEFRLACQARIADADARIEFAPLRQTPQILETRQQTEITPAPMVTRRGDAIYYGDEEIDRYRGHLLGLAIDLGTTTVAVELVDLENGASLQVRSFENPQRFGGSDIMHRISYDGLFPGELRQSLLAALNRTIEDLAAELDFARQEIYEITVAGNSTMRDILFRLDVQGIGQKPYKSLIEHEYIEGKRQTMALTEKTRRLGLRANPQARVYSLPLIGSHVGADTAAALLAIGMTHASEAAMLVDVGTNTEVVIAYRGRMLTASCPAGPAFEGGLIRYGMPGYEGAIESIRVGDAGFEYNTIGGAAPRGICGSGLIDLLAELRRHELMKPKGMFADRSYEMDIVPDAGITFSREDASNLAQAKAANYCGQYILLRHLGLNPRDITHLYLAGGFANYVNVENSMEIGFLAPVPPERVSKVGNAALEGARQALLSLPHRKSIEELVRDIEHIELETTPDFFEIFVEACQFKPMPLTLSPL
jgi:uncharacterized 2Fe-2S/4Fe-4S cluster protein (DUF4445 family)